MRRHSSATSARRSAASAVAIACAAGLLLGNATGAAQQNGQTTTAPSKALSRSTDHLSLTATLSPVAIAPGGRVVLAVDVTPKAGMHVYAPGSQYRAIAIRLGADSPFRLEAPVEYPPAVPYTFKPLNETVPVYAAPFRLIAQLGLNPSKPTVTLLQRRTEVALAASLEYQACDDRVCYLPESVPLRWTVTRLPTPRP